MQDLLFIIPSFAFLRREIEQLVKRFGIEVDPQLARRALKSITARHK
jgi:hypothetical protein